jgi:primosomal protein N' (replication factor Y)
LRLEGEDADQTGDAATILARAARTIVGGAPIRLRGPAPAPLFRLRTRFRWQFMLAGDDVRALHGVLLRLLAAWRAAPASRRVRLIVDVDPVSML